MINLRKKFGKKIKKLRLDNGLTQENLAYKAGISVDFLSLIERGKNSPSFENLEKISKALGVPVWQLFTEENKNFQGRGIYNSTTKQPIIVDKLDEEQRQKLAVKLLEEQLIKERKQLHYWRDITNQPAQIDTGYVAQHLVSLVMGIPGDRMRGKGEDLIDGSEVKSANFLDSLDKMGRIAPRWNFSSKNETIMRNFLKVPKIYLVSIDWNQKQRIRVRIWELDPDKHSVFRKRYLEWMDKKGLPKLSDPKRPDANFQLFPPRSGKIENYARHGSNRSGELSPLKINLEEFEGVHLIFHAEEDEGGKFGILTFNP